MNPNSSWPSGIPFEWHHSECHGIWNHQHLIENIKVPRHWLLRGNPPVTDGFPSQRASNAENVSTWWHHHAGSSLEETKASHLFNTLRLRQNGRHFPDDIFKWIFLNENVWILIKISLKFVPQGPIKNIPALVQIMAWRRPGDKPLSEPMTYCHLHP